MGRQTFGTDLVGRIVCVSVYMVVFSSELEPHVQTEDNGCDTKFGADLPTPLCGPNRFRFRSDITRITNKLKTEHLTVRTTDAHFSRACDTTSTHMLWLKMS